jgi:murein DD-endopeptidase MepM/ murein hydrolase activator NlpD
VKPPVRARRAGGGLLLALALAGCASAGAGIGPVPASLPPASGLAPLPVLSGFGMRPGAGGTARLHTGIDIRAPVGTPVLAAADGEVVAVADRPRAGRLVVVAHADDLATVYMHLAESAVRLGQRVRRGEPIGRAGMSGNATTPHLHFGVCRRPGARCGRGPETGWEDPARHWVEEGPCFTAGRAYPAAPVRLTYPLPCGGG